MSERVPIGDLDLHLFGEGTHRRLWELLGPQLVRDVAPDDGAGIDDVVGVRFTVWAPNATAVAVVGDWNGWSPEPLERVAARGPEPTGLWSADIAAARAGHHYKYELVTNEGRTIRKADPMARRAERPPSDASVVPDPVTHEWHDADWLASRRLVMSGEAPLRIYECHLGSWRRDADDWDTLASQLVEHVGRLGFTHVELLPVAEHPFGGSWGYQVSGYYAPTARFGDPDGFRRFVDTLHRNQLGVIIDWVPAHFPKDDWSLGRFDGTPLYEHPDPQRGEHPDWGTYVFDYGRNEVRNFLVANALYWLDEFHVDGLRVDAVASMLYLDYSRDDGGWTPNQHGGNEHLEAIDFIRETNAVVGEEFPDALMIAEESTAWPNVTKPTAEGGLGFSHKWNMGWMHDTLDYLSRDPVHRSHHHQELTFAQLYAYSERFVLPLSHDEVVHGKHSLLGKMGGDDWQRFAALRALFAWQWASPGAPLLFMGSELASWQEWNDAAELPWHLLEHPSHRGVHDLLGRLNQVHGEFAPLWRRDDEPGGFQWLDADDREHSVYSFLRWGEFGTDAVACVANFTPVPRPGYRVGLPWIGDWDVVIDTDAATWWGSGFRGGAQFGEPEATAENASVRATFDEPWQSQPASAIVDIGPMSMMWLAGRRGADAPAGDSTDA